MKKFFGATLVVFFGALFSLAVQNSDVFADEVADELLEDIAVIETNLGTIEISFFDDKAPGHVKNFKTLAKSGFYDGTTFHRVIPGFMIQGGDPNSKNEDRSMHGMGGPGYSIDAEFNDIKHERGIVSMARSSDPNSAGSQFFICVADVHFLDGNYTVFGKVVKGMEVTDKIVAQIIKENVAEGVSEAMAKGGRLKFTNPVERVEIKSVKIEGKSVKPEGK